MKKIFFIVIAGISFFNSSAFSQGSVVSVDKPTGEVRATIPLYTVSAGGVSLPIALSYATKGVRPTDIEGSAGMGWELIAGGAVTRQLRGLPDDIVGDMLGVSRTGWINSTNGNTINNMTIYNNSNPPYYPNVQTDVNFIQSHFNDLSDTEPDIFYVSAPGLSLKFVFDKDHNIRTIPYQDVKITYSGSGGITSFTVTNDQGITYVFAAAEVTVRKSVPASTPAWFNTDYRQYINGITFNSAWRLTQMHDLYNNAINLNYAATTVMPSTLPVQVYLNGSGTPTTLYTLWQKTTPQIISSITYQEGNGTGSPVTAFNFTYLLYNRYTNATFISTITGFGRNFQFNYTPNVHSGDNYTRYFLSNVTDPDCNTPFNYSFSYNNLANLPDSTSNGQDFWGYTNAITNPVTLEPGIQINPSNALYDRYRDLVSDDGAIPAYPYQVFVGLSRTMNPAYITIGALNQVNYATGGYTTISYEPNDYYDGTVGYVEPGGGIRVNRIAHYDGINTSPTATSYTYLDPGTGASSGKALSLPIFAFTQAYTSTEADSVKWRKSTVISWSDLSREDHSIIYNYVRESRTGAGSTLYQFGVPVTQWDSSTPSGAPSWSPTTIYSGSPTTNAIGFLNNITRTYPFPPNTNYEFERNLPLDVTSYDNNNNKVSESTYTYTTPQAPVTITAFKYDTNTSAEWSYGKYFIYTSAAPLAVQVVTKLFSLAAPASYRQTTETFAYNGLLHKRPTQQTTTNSDGTVYNKYFKYVKDYTITTSGDAMTQALLNLQVANVNVPIEEYAQVTPSGQSATTVSADLVNYNVFTPSGTSLTLPSVRMKIAAPGGTAFTPSSISTSSPNTFLYDNSHYTVVENDLGYDYSGYLLSKDNGFKHITTVLTDHNSFQPAAVIDNARYDEIAFSDFDSKLPAINFTGTTTLSATSRSGQYANSLGAGVTLSKTVNRNLLAANYIISAWIQCSGTAGTISATIVGGSNSNPGSATYAVTTANPTLYPTGWQYVEFKVPVANITTGTMAITISCSTNVIIDDVWAYPDIAEVSAYAYDPVAFFKTAATNTNGVASYFSYDKFGRPVYTYDQDKNIVQRKIYASSVNETNFTAPALSGPSTAYNHVSASWSMSTPSYNSCITASGVTYTWNFGDGTAPIVTSSYSPVNHAYLTNGSYPLTLTVSSPAYGSKASSLTVNVSNLPQTNITYTNTTSGSSISSVVFKQHSTGTIIYTLTTAQLAAGYNITPDIYDITINPAGPQYSSGTGLGYNTVSLNAGSLSLCFAYTGSAFVASNTDLRYEPSASFGMYTALSCP